MNTSLIFILLHSFTKKSKKAVAAQCPAVPPRLWSDSLMKNMGNQGLGLRRGESSGPIAVLGCAIGCGWYIFVFEHWPIIGHLENVGLVMVQAHAVKVALNSKTTTPQKRAFTTAARMETTTDAYCTTHATVRNEINHKYMPALLLPFLRCT